MKTQFCLKVQLVIILASGQSLTEMLPLYYLNIEKVIENFTDIESLFPSNPTSKNAFLAVCHAIDSSKDLRIINKECEFGGLIGPGNSNLHPVFEKFKLFRVHAAFHDAFGFMKTQYNLGPGYVYMLGEKPKFKNSCLLGHFTGLLVWIYLKMMRSQKYTRLPF